MSLHLHSIVAVQESQKLPGHTVSLLQLKKCWWRHTQLMVSGSHWSTMQLLPSSRALLPITYMSVFTSGMRTLSTATRAIPAAPRNKSCSREGKQHKLRACTNRINYVREQSFPKNIYSNKLPFSLSYIIHKVSTSFNINTRGVLEVSPLWSSKF